MDASDLKIFEAVARLGGMSRAAAELSTVQSNVTARVQHLEAELGVQLFDRHSRGVTPTAAGRRLLPHAALVRQALAEARRAVQDADTPAGPLVIGSLETTAALRLSPVLAGFAAAHPAVDLALRTGTSAEMIDAVLARDVEGAFVCGPVAHPALQQVVAFREEMVLATARSIASLDALAAAEDVKTIVLRAGCSYRQRLEDILARRGIVGSRQLEFGTIEAIVACVGAGLGITLLPRGVLEPAARGGRLALHSLPGDEAEAETLFVSRRDSAASAALTAFLRHALSDSTVARAAE